MKNEAIVHYSGGSDSTLCAALMAERFDKVHLLTYDRFSFIGAVNYTNPNYERLCKIYGESKFIRKIVSIERLHRQICFQNYFKIAWNFRLSVTALCFSKLAMHWYSSAYAVRNRIGTVADGAVPYMDLYPDQNENIGMKALADFYEKKAIKYENPVYSIANEVEQILYDKGIIDTPDVRGTKSDKQVFYVEQVLLAFFLKYYLTTHGKEKYEEQMAALYRNRIEMMAQTKIRVEA